MIECPYCKAKMKQKVIPMTFKGNPDIIVENVRHNVCMKCGFESIPEKEYEIIRKKVNSVIKISKEAKTVII